MKKTWTCPNCIVGVTNARTVVLLKGPKKLLDTLNGYELNAFLTFAFWEKKMGIYSVVIEIDYIDGQFEELNFKHLKKMNIPGL